MDGFASNIYSLIAAWICISSLVYAYIPNYSFELRRALVDVLIYGRTCTGSAYELNV